MFSVINCQTKARPVQQSCKTQPDREIGKDRPAGIVSSSCLTPPPLLGIAGEGGRGGGGRLFFTVRDLIARRFHYLCTNVTFSSDQGAWQPLAEELARSQTLVQRAFSQTRVPERTEVSRGTKRQRYGKHTKSHSRVVNTKLTVQHLGKEKPRHIY